MKQKSDLNDSIDYEFQEHSGKGVRRIIKLENPTEQMTTCREGDSLKQQIFCIKEGATETEKKISVLSQTLSKEIKQLGEMMCQLTQVAANCKQTVEQYPTQIKDAFSEVKDAIAKSQEHTQYIAANAKETKETLDATMGEVNGLSDKLTETITKTKALAEDIRTLRKEVSDIDRECQYQTQALAENTKETIDKLSTFERTMTTSIDTKCSKHTQFLAESAKMTKDKLSTLERSMCAAIDTKCQKHTQALAENAKETKDKLSTLEEIMTAVINTTSQEHTQALIKNAKETEDKLSTLEKIMTAVINTKCWEHTQALSESAKGTENKLSTLERTMAAIIDTKCLEHTQALARNVKETNDTLSTLEGTMTAVINTKCQEHTQDLVKKAKEAKDNLSTLEKIMTTVIDTKCVEHAQALAENAKETKDKLNELEETINTKCQEHAHALAEKARETKEELCTIKETMAKVSGFSDDINETRRKTEGLYKDMATLREKLVDIVIKCQEHTQGPAKNVIETKDKLNTLEKTIDTKCHELNQTIVEHARETKDSFSFIRNWLLFVSLLHLILIGNHIGVQEIFGNTGLSLYSRSSNAPVPIENNDVITNNKLHEFEFSIKQIKQKFPSETGRFWSSMFTPIQRVILEERPSHPAMVLIATTWSTRTVAECLARAVATMVESLYDRVPGNIDPYITLESQEMKSLSPDESRSEMENVLSSNFEQGHMAAVIHDLGSLPPEAAVIMHAYCGHNSTRFRKAVILATVYLDPGVPLTAGQIETYLSNAWIELGEDILNNLLSKFVNYVAVMSSEGTVDHCNTWE